MSYVWRDGKVWLTASSQRPRIKAVRRDDRVSVAISSAGTRMPPATVTIKGRCAILEDAETKRWFYPALAAVAGPAQRKAAGRVRANAGFAETDRYVRDARALHHI